MKGFAALPAVARRDCRREEHRRADSEAGRRRIHHPADKRPRLLLPPPRAAIADRFKRSGKDKLILLIASDFDSDGEEIAHSLARSMRDDFGIEDIKAVKVALTHAQVAEFDLPPNSDAKTSSAQYRRFAERYGNDVDELEAIPPTDLQRLLREAIDSVIDIDAFNTELTAEREDAAFLDETRQRMHTAVRGAI